MDVCQFPANRGNSDDVSAVISAYADMVYRIAYMRTKTPHDADDVFQNVFLAYMQSDRNFETEEHRKAWLIKVTVNSCAKLLGSSWFKKTVPLEDDTLHYELPEQYGLLEAIRKLPEKRSFCPAWMPSLPKTTLQPPNASDRLCLQSETILPLRRICTTT